ncbi:unnamed protein product [Meganyctiphanes norvegica]|uniref:Origin recognition complex subunit 6 n=1 Tax=Meganyctiphanes norvegica TaxID=48144 RepID=A0AAV2PUH7_MEGNR
MDSQMLRSTATKLGISSQKTLRKAEELIRLLSVKGGNRMSLGTSAKAVICLELAASLTGATVEKSQVIGLSGLKRPAYAATSQTVERLLGVTSGVSITGLCVTHTATSAKDLAIKVLKEYESQMQKQGGVDGTLAVFQAAAVLSACKVMKVRVDKKSLYEASKSKRAVYDKVVEAMTKIAEEINTKKTVVVAKRGKTILDMVEDHMREESPEKRRKLDDDQEKGTEATDEEFDEWKKRILAQAQSQSQE